MTPAARRPSDDSVCTLAISAAIIHPVPPAQNTPPLMACMCKKSALVHSRLFTVVMSLSSRPCAVVSSKSQKCIFDVAMKESARAIAWCHARIFHSKETLEDLSLKGRMWAAVGLATAPILGVCHLWDFDNDKSAATKLWWISSSLLCLCVTLAAAWKLYMSKGEDNVKALFVSLTYLWRAVFQSQETERVCIMSTRACCAVAHRAAGALGETVAYAVVSKRLFPGGGRLALRRCMLASIVLAQTISFAGVIAKSELYFVFENTLWTISGVAGLAIHSRKPEATAFPRAGKIAFSTYVLYMLLYDLPMYARRAVETRDDPHFNVGLVNGFADAFDCRTVSRDDEVWRHTFNTHLLNFVLAPLLVLRVVSSPEEHPKAKETAPSVQSRGWLECCCFLYLLQIAGYFHVGAHYVTAKILGVDAELRISYHKLLPIYGIVWDKFESHEAFMCAYQNSSLLAAAPWRRVAIGFSGPYAHLAYLLLIGAWLGPSSRDRSRYRAYACCVLAFFLVFQVWSAIWFYDDPTGDYALLTGAPAATIASSSSSKS